MDADSRVSKLDHPGWVFGGYIIVKWLLLQVTACDTQNESVGHQLEIRVHFATAHLLPDAIGTYFGKGLIFLSLKWLPCLYANMSLCVSGLISKMSGLFNISTFREQSRRKASLQHRLDPPNRHNPARKCLVGQGGGDEGTACGSERGLERPTAVQSNS